MERQREGWPVRESEDEAKKEMAVYSKASIDLICICSGYWKVSSCFVMVD
jgi:hypothetical protein